eukprot:jgi/Psemu1/284557/fgenesh1_pg.57_\
MTKQTTTARVDRAALFFLAATATLPLATHGLMATSPLNNPLSNPKIIFVTNSGIGHRVGKSNRHARKPLTTIIHSKKNELQTDEFRDINIDDVLLEAENALKAAETSLVDSDEIGTDGDTVLDDFKEAVLLTKEESKTKIGDEVLMNFEEATRDALPPDREKIKNSVTATEIISSAIGGIILGLVLGAFASFELSDLNPSLDSILDPDFSVNALELAVPIIFGGTLGGIVGFTGSIQDGLIGLVVRSVLGLPVKALASAIVNSIQDTARRQLEKATDDIKAIPSNVANSAKQKAAQKAMEARLTVEVAIDAAIERAKKILLVLAVLSSIGLVGMFVMDGGLPFLTETSSQLF